jgi:hypothetical protein
MPKTAIETNTKTRTSSPQQPRPRTRPQAAHPAAIIQRARAAPESLSRADVLQLQRTIGNRAVGRMLAEIGRIPSRQAPVQSQPEPDEPVQAQTNRTGIPDHLKSGLENLSGMDLSGVRVQYSTSRPAQLNALAYTQGQERHLPHEGWHAVQQMQGRVRPTMQLKGWVAVNNDKGWNMKRM